MNHLEPLVKLNIETYEQYLKIYYIPENIPGEILTLNLH